MIKAPVSAAISPVDVCLSYTLDSSQINTFIKKLTLELTSQHLMLISPQKKIYEI